MAKTKIEWTEFSWNPVTGCSKVSEGCRFCFAERMAHRLAGRYGYPKAPHHFDVTLHPDKLDVPLRRKKPTTYFVCSMSDLFHETVPDDFICDVFYTMYQNPQHTFQVLTKRPQRMLDWFNRPDAQDSKWHEPLPNICLGISAENQAAADERIPILLQIPAAVRFVSCEPLLESITLKPYLYGWHNDPRPAEQDPGIDWVIIGGESGPGARPMMINWAEDIVGQCRIADVPVFVKQVGTWAAKRGRYESHKGNDPAEWPRALQVREMPA